LTETSKQALAKFLEYPEVKSWFDGVATELKESTREQYLIFLMRYLGKEDPVDFLKRTQEDPRQVGIEIKGRLGEIYKHSMHAAHITKYALRSFLDFHETNLQIKAKVKVRRKRKKPELSWEDADAIIIETDEPYRTLFKFMKWSGLGEDEVMEIQASPSIQESIGKQKTNDKTYIKIDLSPRKSTLDEFFTLAPKQYLPKFPLNTKTYKDRGSKLIDPHDMQNVWRRAAKKAKLWQEGLGPHTLRSAFKSQCNASKVADAVSEFCMGHGGGDRYGYAREVLNEQYVASELRKFWAGQSRVPEETVKRAAMAMALAPYEDKLSPDEFHALESKLERILPMTVSYEFARKAQDFASTALKQHEAVLRSRSKKRRMVRTARNGGTPIGAAYETRIVREEELVPLLDQGFDVVRELRNGRIIIRRPFDREETVSAEA
jgi:hypothetical protein